MAAHRTTEGVYGPGSFTDVEFTALPLECERLLRYFVGKTPGFKKDPDFLQKVTFYGQDLPIIPGPLKSQAVSAVSHAMIGLAASEICALRGVDVGAIRISVDHAGLYPGTPALVNIDQRSLRQLAQAKVAESVGADLDRGMLSSTAMRYRSWAIYRTRNADEWYQVLGNLHPAEYLAAFGLGADAATAATRDEAYALIGAEMQKYSAAELEVKNMAHGFCGQTCYTPAQWRATAMARSLARHPLLNVRPDTASASLPPVPFPAWQTLGGDAADRRPLKGVRVIELARVIAAPAMCAALASLGAEVIKVQSPALPDLQSLNLTLTAGKRSCALDLTREADREYLEGLMEGADVIVQAFRLGSLERKGFGPSAAFEMARKRGKGVVYVDLNCYGPDGYYAERPGFQQIADAATGCTYVCGKAYGAMDGAPTLPSLPIADMLCGSFGVVDVLMALRDRATKGGSYHAHVALTSVDTAQLEQEVGLYNPEIVKSIQEKLKFKPMTPDLMVSELLGVVHDAWETNTDFLKNEKHFVTFERSAFGKEHRILAPVVEFGNEDASLRWDGPPVPYCFETGVNWA